MTRIAWQTTLLEQADVARIDEEPCLEIGLLLLAKVLELTKPSRVRYGRMLSDMTMLVFDHMKFSPWDVAEGDGK